MPDARTAMDVIVEPFGLSGILVPPADDLGVVLFAHGAGSSRFSPRNNYVARSLQAAGLGTFLFDLLTEAEAQNRANVFDIALLVDRLLAATEHLRRHVLPPDVPIGYFGASTGAAAALGAAARAPHPIGAVVSRGGRPDLAGSLLPAVTAPTLLIVGSLDEPVIVLNQQAFAELRCERQLVIVQGAGHLFEEPGTLDAVIELARAWFLDHLRRSPP